MVGGGSGAVQCWGTQLWAGVEFCFLEERVGVCMLNTVLLQQMHIPLLLASITSLGLSVLKRVPSILANTLTKILRNSAGRTDPKA